MINPYTIAGLLLLLIATAFGGARIGAKLERESWQAEKIALQAAHIKEIDAAALKYDRKVKFDEAIARKVDSDHAKEIILLHNEHGLEVAAIKRAGGLRVPANRPVVPGAAAAQTPGVSQPDAGPAGTVRLPEEVEDSLFRIAEDADKVSADLRALQAWVRANGFYGEPPP